MSYARHGVFGSDVYVYHGDGLHCCECLIDDGGQYDTDEWAEMIAHLKEHVKHGHCVPQRTFDRLERELKSGEIENIFADIDLEKLAKESNKNDK